MAVGIRVRNNSFTTQIDQNFKNYGYQQVIPVGVTIVSPSVSEQGIVQVTVSGQNALVGVRCTLFYYIPLGSYYDGLNWIYTFKFIAEFSFTGTLSETVYFYVFNTPPNSGFSNLGIRVRNPATGEIAYHSDMRPLYMEAKNTCTTPFSGGSARVWCPIVTRFCFINNFYTGVGYRLEPYGLRTTATGIEVKQFTQPSNYAAFFTWYDPGEYAVIDVTGIS